jgi:hypothetical protein
MNTRFDYDGRIYTLRVSIGPRSDGTIGPPLEVIVDAPDPGDLTVRCCKREP